MVDVLTPRDDFKSRKDIQVRILSQSQTKNQVHE
jgi:hypothetical protein